MLRVCIAIRLRRFSGANAALFAPPDYYKLHLDAVPNMVGPTIHVPGEATPAAEHGTRKVEESGESGRRRNRPQSAMQGRRERPPANTEQARSAEVPKEATSDCPYLRFATPMPEKPDTPQTCCMSGCVHCVWTLYVDDYVRYKQALRSWHQARFQWAHALRDSSATPPSSSPEKPPLTSRQRAHLADIMCEDRNALEAIGKSAEDVFEEALQEMDPSIRVFWEIEHRLDDKKKDGQASA